MADAAHHGANGGAARPPAGLRLLRRFLRNERGATAVEFAIVALPFFGLIFAVLETALVFLAGQMLETAVSDSARLIMTGQAQTQKFTPSDFKASVCSHLAGMFDCEAGVKIDVRVCTGFNDCSTVVKLDANGNLDTSNYGYNPGQGGEIVLVSALYEWPVFVSLLGLDAGDLPNGKRLLVASAAFQNEPFS